MNDYEQALIELLRPVVAPVPVASRPLGGTDTAPRAFVVVRRVGGAATSRVREDITMTVEGYAPTQTAAHQLVELARGWLLERAASVAETGFIRKVSELAGPALLPDPSRPGLARYTITISLVARRRLTHR